MRIVVVGLGVQGEKRARVAGKDLVATVDPVKPGASFKRIEDVPLESYDAALCCIPDQPKYDVLTYLLTNKKHVLVEKPLWVACASNIDRLQSLAREKNVVCYTAYNHRFEPHFIKMRDLIQSGTLGRIYSCRLFYGNGTARLVRESAWRDQGSGVMHDLGSHLLDTLFFWFGTQMDASNFYLSAYHAYENKAPDFVKISNEMSLPRFDLDMTLLSWRNHFTCDIFAEAGSAHIESLCKWGPSQFTVRKRILPSGRPTEESITYVQPDPTWEEEYGHFKNLCLSRTSVDLSTDKLIFKVFEKLEKDSNLLKRSA